MAQPDREVVLWPSSDNYDEFRRLCDDEVPATFNEFEALAGPRLAHVEKTYGIKLDKLSFDPQRMATWCRAHYGKVDAEARKSYAGYLALQD